MNADVHALAGAYALDALPSDERAFFERHLDVCDACRAEVAELTETAARLGSAVAQTPPPGLRERVLAAADVTRQLPPQPEPAPAFETRPARVRATQRWLMPVAACLALVAVALTGLAVNLNRRLGEERELAAEQAAVVSILAAEDFRSVELEMGDSTARFMYSPAEDEGVIVATGIPDVGDDQTYELWLIHDGSPINAGLFRPGEGGTAVATIEGPSVRGAERIAVTVEPAAGSGKPTSPILASAEL